MAANERKITLTLDLKVEKERFKEISDLLGKDLGKNITGSKAAEYMQNIKNITTEAVKSFGDLANSLSKPLITKSQAKELANNIDEAFKVLDNRMFSLQGSLSKVFNSASNAEALKQIRELGKAIDEMMADYAKASELLSQSKSIGSKTDLKSQLSAATKELNALSKNQEKLTKAEIKRQEELSKIIDEINQKLAEKNRLSQEASSIQAIYGVTSQAGLSAAINEKIADQRELINGSVSIKEMATLRTLLEDIRNAIANVRKESDLTSARVTANADREIEKAVELERQGKTIQSVLKDLGIPLLTLREVANAMRRVIRYSYDYIKNLDAALTEIAIVSGKSRAEVLQLTNTFIELSARTGMAIDDIAKASTIYYQQGLNDEAVRKLTEYTAIFAKISSETVEVASNQITAAINGFNLSVDRAGDVIDKLSVLAAYSAADIDELATAMSKAASQANMAGLSFDQYNAYLATMIEVTREAPENIGTSLKTIMSRFQSIKTGENTEDDVDVNQVETALRSVNVALRDSEGQLRDLGEVLEELGPKWNGLSRNTQAYLGTIIAGTRQQSRFISLMQNWDRALELTTASQNSAGAATRMHQAAMEGLDAALNNLTNAWQRLISNIANGDTFKGLINVATSLLKFFGQGNSALRLFTAAIILFNARTLITNANLAAQHKHFTNLDIALKTLKGTLGETRGNLEDLNNANGRVAQGIEAEIEYVNTLTASYKNLTTAKMEAAGVQPDGTIVPVGGPSAKGTKTTTTKVKQPTKTGTNIPKANGGTILSNATSLVGKISMITMAVSTLLTAFDLIQDALVTTSDELRERAQKQVDATQKEIDKRNDIIQAAEQSGEVYEKLSHKINKSTDEINQMADAAANLAEVIPGALVGYDLEGNAIIDINKVKETAKNAQEELAEYSKEQIGNIGKLMRADLRKQAEEQVAANSPGYKTATGVGLAAAGTGTAVALGVAGTNFWNPVGWVAAGVAIVGLITAGISEGLKESEIKETARREALAKAQKIYDEYADDLATYMANVTKRYVTEGIINNTTGNDRAIAAGYMGRAWLKNRTSELYQQFENKELSDKEYEAAFQNLGTEWEEVIKKIGNSGLASLSKEITKISRDLGSKTFASVENSVEAALDQLNIQDAKLFKMLKEGIMDAIYSGYDQSIYNVITDLRNRLDQELKGVTNNNQRQAISNKYNTVINDARRLTNDQVNFYSQMGIFNDVDMYAQFMKEKQDEVNEALKNSTEEAALQVIAYYGQIQREAEAKMAQITDTTSDEYQEQVRIAQNAAYSIQKAWESMAISADIPWKTLWETLEKTTERLRTVGAVYVDVLSGEGADFSNWKEFTELFDNIDFSHMSDETIAAYGNALEAISENLTVVNGKIYANAEAIQTIGQVERMIAEESIEATRQELRNKQIELEAQQAVIDAEIATLEWKIAEAEGSADAEDKKIKAQEAWNTASDQMSKVWVVNQKKVTEAMVNSYLSSFAAIGTAYNKLVTSFNGKKISKSALEEFKQEWTNTIKDLNFEAYSTSLDQEGYSLSQLRQQLEAAKTASKINQASIQNIDLKLANLQPGIWEELAGAGGSGKSGSSSDGIDRYIGKLKEIYNILNRIQVLEHRLGVLDQYQDIVREDGSGELIKERIDLNKELMEQYKFLTQEQKRFANGYADFIQSVDGLEDVFEFDKYGQIIIHWEKYNELSREAAKGQVSLKEKADDVYETYTNMFTDLQGYFNKTIDYLKNVIKLTEEVINAYVTIEEKTADAIKEIYQEILNTRLEAIDKEKEAIEELRKERERANKEQSDAKEVAGIQSDIQRALMDTSGASATALIKAQNRLDDKLSSIADDKYSEMVDNVLNKLDEEKAFLQDEFDQMFHDLRWLFLDIEENLMNDRDGIVAILTQTQQWAESAPIRQREYLQEWDTYMDEYMDVLGDGKSIYDLWEDLQTTRQEVVAIDQKIADNVSQYGSEITRTIQEWEDKVSEQNKQLSSAISGLGSRINGLESRITQQENTKTTPKEAAEAYTAGGGGYSKGGGGNGSFGSGGSGGSDITLGLDPTSFKSVRSYMYNSSTNTMQVGFNRTAAEIGKFNSRQSKTIGGVKYWYNSSLGVWFREQDLKKYAGGGFADFAGPAWLDGSPQKPEAVLDALQTKHFIDFTNTLDRMYGEQTGAMSNAITIDTISFNVESMSSPEDGEKAFSAFVNKFNEIGSQTGIKFNNFRNTL